MLINNIIIPGKIEEWVGELGPITNSAWYIFWRIRIACLEDSAHPSGELGLPPSELGLPQIYYKNYLLIYECTLHTLSKIKLMLNIVLCCFENFPEKIKNIRINLKLYIQVISF